MSVVVTPDIAAWRRLSLAELNERAALLDREENKYLVNGESLDAALELLRPDFAVLDINGGTEFTYDTVYFDTSDLRCYRDHATGRRLRAKVRSRLYVDSDLCYFEIKLKGRRGRTLKSRLPYTPQNHGRVTAEAAEFFDDRMAAVYGRSLGGTIRPALAMNYRRVTLVGLGAPERVTIDFGISFRMGEQGTDSFNEVAIVEVKSPDGRGLADQALRAVGARSEGCSKYCVGLNLLTDDLPNHAFRRLIDRHFAGGAD